MAARNPALPPDFSRAEEKFRQALREAHLNDTAQRRHVLHVFLRAMEPVRTRPCRLSGLRRCA